MRLTALAVLAVLCLSGCQPRALSFGTVTYRTDTLDGMKRSYAGAERMVWEMHRLDIALPTLTVPERITDHDSNTVWESVQMRPWERGRHTASIGGITVIYRTDWSLMETGVAESAFAGQPIDSGHNWMGWIGGVPFFMSGHEPRIAKVFP